MFKWIKGKHSQMWVLFYWKGEMYMKNVGDGVLKEVTKIIIQPDGYNAKAIATITADKIELAKGYVLRLVPNQEEK
jgi:hypothetical protein